jgi:FtsP/CotA-like multicopper oxidase with cupredoxin domain
LAATERAGYALYESRDGIPLARIGPSVPRKPDQPTDYPNAILMAPGQRIDVLVQAGKSGSYMFRAVPHDQGYNSPIGPIARLVVEGDPLPMNLPTKLPTPREKLIGDEEITGTRVLTFSGRDDGLAEVQVHDRRQDFRSRSGRSVARDRGKDSAANLSLVE